MSKLIVKDTALINATYSLSLVEQRLVLLAILETRQKGRQVSYDKPLKVSARSYAEHFNVDRSTAYQSLQAACKTLLERRFSYQEQREKGIANITSRWVSSIAYIDSTATVELFFAQPVIPLITQLEKHFTSYEIEQIAGLSSGYAVRLYELLIAWRSVGKVPPIQLQELRDRLGVLDNEYERMHHFKARVLEFAIKQINEHTDITARYEQHKVGRKIDSISFTFKHKAADKKNTNDGEFIKMTSEQIRTFSNKLAALPEVGSHAPMGASTEQFATLIAEELKDASKQKKYIPSLKKLDFKSANQSTSD